MQDKEERKTMQFEESRIPTIASTAVALPAPSLHPHSLTIDLSTSVSALAATAPSSVIATYIDRIGSRMWSFIGTRATARNRRQHAASDGLVLTRPRHSNAGVAGRRWCRHIEPSTPTQG